MSIRSLLDLIHINLYPKSGLTIFFIILILFMSCFMVGSLSQKIDLIYEQSAIFDEGQILYSPLFSTNTYLRESTGMLNHTWHSSYFPGSMVKWLGDGTILRSIRTGGGPPMGGAGGGIQKVEWDGTVFWDFRYNTDGLRTHHDIELLPNGNVLMIAWETKTRSQAIAAGRNPSYVSNNGLMPDHVIEVQPTGPTSGDVVWEWHMWDHLIQDHDPSKENYGVIGNHPELIDINYVTSQQLDFSHTNSIDYNEEFDQILLSVRYYNEVWIIDHSTTTEEAAGHTGGNSGKGGDLLYRWGNPRVYDAGTAMDEKFFNQHDATWIDDDSPGAGNILVFNNGVNRPGSRHSSVDEIVPPVDDNGEYYLEEGSAYGPEEQTWIYTANPPSSFYSNNCGGAHRLKNGNTIITNGDSGRVFEVTADKETVWLYNTGSSLFKAEFIPPEGQEPPEPNTPDLDCSGSLSWAEVGVGATVSGSFLVQNIGDANSLLNWTIDISSIGWGSWSINPSHGENLTPEYGPVTVQVSVVAPNEKESEFSGYVRVENDDDPEDFELIMVDLVTPVNHHSVVKMIYQFLCRLFG
jgi:hypothetical protein